MNVSINSLIPLMGNEVFEFPEHNIMKKMMLKTRASINLIINASEKHTYVFLTQTCLHYTFPLNEISLNFVLLNVRKKNLQLSIF